MHDDDEARWASRAYGPPHMRMIELPIAAVVVDPGFNCRAYTAEEIAEACDQFESQPMLHAPTVARVGGEWRLVAGFRRFAVWQVKGVADGVFRWIDATDARELLITNLVENIGRRDLRPHELVEAFVRLQREGLDAYEIAARCQCSDRWVRRLWSLQRSAHPELWSAFVAGTTRHLTLTRMLDLADHPPAVQLQRWRQMLGAAERADEHARGYRESAGENPPPPPPSRRRLPSRRRAERMRRHIERDAALDPAYRQGALDVFAWFLRGTDLPARSNPSGGLRSELENPTPTPEAAE